MYQVPDSNTLKNALLFGGSLYPVLLWAQEQGWLPEWAPLLALCVLVTLDTITGITVSLSLKQRVNSYRMRAFMGKVIMYALAILVVGALGAAMADRTAAQYLMRFIVTLACYIEAKSIVENMRLLQRDRELWIILDNLLSLKIRKLKEAQGLDTVNERTGKHLPSVALIALIATPLLFASCAPCNRAEHWLERCPTAGRDTLFVTRYVTHVVKGDTETQILRFTDTLRVDRERLVLRVHTDTVTRRVHVHAHCKPDTVRIEAQDRIITVTKQAPRTWWQRASALILAIVILLTLTTIILWHQIKK